MGSDPFDDPDVTLRDAGADDEAFQLALFGARRAAPLRLAGVPERVVENLVATQHRARALSFGAAHPDARWLIVEVSGVPAGELVLDVREDVARVLDITLAPERQRRGLGCAALRVALRDVARRQEVRALIDVANAPSRKMFAKAGFVECKFDDVHVEAILRRV